VTLPSSALGAPGGAREWDAANRDRARRLRLFACAPGLALVPRALRRAIRAIGPWGRCRTREAHSPESCSPLAPSSARSRVGTPRLAAVKRALARTRGWDAPSRSRDCRARSRRFCRFPSPSAAR